MEFAVEKMRLGDAIDMAEDGLNCGAHVVLISEVIKRNYQTKKECPVRNCVLKWNLICKQVERRYVTYRLRQPILSDHISRSGFMV